MTPQEICKNKIRYSSDMEAAAASGRLSVKYNHPPNKWYRCTVCLGWHLTKREYDGFFERQNRIVKSMVIAKNSLTTV